ncbi:MAG: hypothetical protein IMZ69_00615 [Spirochaetes bacterium]|nr:hypothetical protein [Spirochaetota bacterium]
MKRFSKIQETKNPESVLRLCFEFKANEDPAGDLHSAGLVIAQSITGVHGGHEWEYWGHAYVLSDAKVNLERAQELLRKKGWGELRDEELRGGG